MMKGGMQIASQNSVRALLKKDAYRTRFTEVLGKRAPQFCSSLVSLSQQPHLAKCDPNTVIAAAMVAASLDLAIVPTFGFAYVVPYRGRAQFQIGYKGLVQLAQRTGKYKHINAFLVYEGDTLEFNPVTSEIQLVRGEGENRLVKGYGSYMALCSGFEHAIYWTRQEVEEHALKYSEGYRAFKDGKIKSNPWDSHFNEMALKTVLKRLLLGWGPLSIQMEQALERDTGVQSSIDAQPMFEDAIEAEAEEAEEAEEVDNSTVSVVTPLEEPQPDPEEEKPSKSKAKAKAKAKAPSKKVQEAKWSVVKILQDHKIEVAELCQWAKDEFSYEAETVDDVPEVMLRNIADAPEAWLSQFNLWKKSNK